MAATKASPEFDLSQYLYDRKHSLASLTKLLKHLDAIALELIQESRDVLTTIHEFDEEDAELAELERELDAEDAVAPKIVPPPPSEGWWGRFLCCAAPSVEDA